MPSPCLKEFIITVPTCLQTTALAAALKIFSQNRCDSLVLVTEQQHPVGVLHLSDLLPDLMAEEDALTRGRSDAGCSPTTLDPSSSKLESSGSYGMSLQPLDLSLVQPLATLPGDLTLEEFWPHFQQRSDWAVVDGSGKFLGRIDCQRLLQFVLAHPQAILAREQPPNRGSGAKVEEKSLDAIRGSLNPLIQLLERLPLPMMLQTGKGKVVQQNFAWRRHFISLQDPDWLRREAATLLETVPTQPDVSESINLHSRRSRTNLHLVSTNEEGKLVTLTDSNRIPLTKKKGKSKAKAVKEPAPAIAQPNLHPGVSLYGNLPTSDPAKSHLCQIGPNPDSCVCVCPMDNGSDRVWQFVKIPLGNMLSSLEVKAVAAIATEPLFDSMPVYPFRLAPFQASESSIDVRDLRSHVGQELIDIDLWLVLAQDVTEQQQVAQELAAKNADLIQLNRLKDEFLACISHELKTPLTAVLGLSSLLKDRLLGELNARQTRYVRLIHQSGRHLMAVVNDILDLTRIETGQVELMLSAVDIRTACDRAYEQARSLYLTQNNPEQEENDTPEVEPHFTLEIEPGLNSLIADELRLRQMLVHLLSNALKFTESTGSIGLRVSRWEGFVAFCVWDTGIGIPEEKQHLIFQKFQQLESPLTRQFQGTGLGLVLTQRLAHLHGGDVSFTSYEGAGSQFTLLLPPCPPQEAGDRERVNASPAPRDRSRLVLIVEATSRFIEDLTQKLTSLGYRVAIARSGTEALAKARALQPLAILIDPLLPLLSGWDVLTLLKSNPQTRHIPAIVTATMVEKKQAQSNRADGFLSLPIQMEMLRQCLEQLTAVPIGDNPQPNPATALTILYVTSDSAKVGDTHLSQVLHRHHYRVLEADDLDQAELLARIWSPRVVLLDRGIAEPLNYLQQLNQHQALAILPLVTLDPAIAKAANQIKGLSVFPCLEAPGSPTEASAVLQAIQVAVGISWKPNILALNIGMLPDINQAVVQLKPVGRRKLKSRDVTTSELQRIQEKDYSPSDRRYKKRTEWLQALTQYLQTAGFKGAIARSWDEVLRQIQHCSVDLLIIELADSTPYPAAMKVFHALRQFDSRPATLVLVRQSKLEASTDKCGDGQPLPATEAMPEFLTPPLLDLVQEVATQIVPASLSMKELLERIRQQLGTGD